ncbi:MAG TPA: hypothetical protein VH518_07930 [Tepidisphaeraceae bacterium]
MSSPHPTAPPSFQAPPPPPAPPAPPAPQVMPAGGYQVPDERAGHRISFWQEPAVQSMLPLATSIIFHMAVVVVGFLLIGKLPIITQPTREQVIIPEAAMVDGAEVGGIPNPGLGGDPNLAAAQNVDPNITAADGWSSKRSESLTTTLMGGEASDAQDSVIGLGSRSGIAGSGGPGAGGAGGDGGGPMAPFGVPGGGAGLGPKSPFMGISGNAKRVVYICDASGSMMDVFWRVKNELRKAVEVLKPIQAFNVIFFSDVEITALTKKDLLMATPVNKRKAFELSESMSSAGITDPLPAIRLAFEQQPELIYVLTDGFDNVVSFDAVINEFRKLNPAKKVRVNTILIRSTANAELEKVVRTIASENGGVCKIIDRQDL